MPLIPNRQLKTTDIVESNVIVLTEEQENAIDILVSGTRRKQFQTLGGYGGSGKTTMTKKLSEILKGYKAVAYTGKAAHNLRQKGIPASTIHSLIYMIDKDEEEDTKRWILKPRELLGVDGFICDEASMVSRQIHQDLMSYGLPIIYIGDHGQLEPISTDKFNLMQNPDIKLEKIHRNAGPIARFAEWVRKGNNPLAWDNSQCEDIVSFVRWSDNDPSVWTTDQIICGYNSTRVSINKFVRDVLEYPSNKPVVGDRVICLQNNRELGIFNGMQGEITYVNTSNSRLVFLSDGVEYKTHYYPEVFNTEKPKIKYVEGVVPFDYAYCVSVHKFQGSEADEIAVIDERLPFLEYKRWAYTAASRAKTKLVWVSL